jgi:PAS domain S-box-containing protein
MDSKLRAGNNQNALVDSTKTLRLQAEAIARARDASAPISLEAQSPEAIRNTLHQLQVQQIELEMQNEALRQTQYLLHASHARYMDLYDLAPVGYCTINEQGVISEANVAVASLFGLARNALTGQQLSNLIIKDDQDLFNFQCRQLMDIGTPQACELRILKSQTAVVWIHLAGTMHLAADGSPEIRVVMSDINERKLSEFALHASEDRFRAFVTASSDAVYRMSADWSDMLQLHGKDFIASAETTTNTWLQEYIHPDDQPQVMTAINAAIATKSIFELEHRVRRLDGSLGWTYSHAVPLLNEQGEIIEWFGAASDVTERKHAAQALRESDERYYNLFNSIDEGFCVIELIFDEQEKPSDYRFLEVNAAFEKQSGLHNATGKRILELVPEFDISWFEIYGNVLRTGEPIRLVNNTKSMNRWFDIYAFQIGGPESRKLAVIFNDATERKLIEAEKEKLDQALHEKNIDLEHATMRAEKANLAKSDFLSSMSHELRTPLSAILGFAQLLESGSPEPTPMQKRSVDQILQSGWYLLDLINEILDLSLIESGKLSLSLEPICLVRLMQECEEISQSQSEKRSVNMVFLGLENSCFVKADRTRLKQVLLNLLSNAIKYNKVGGTVEVSYRLSTPGRIRICIKDSGEGLSEEKISQLFQPFNRLGQEFSDVQGTGIGLVVCKRLVELMNGSIGVESKLEEGSVFWIELNLAQATQSDAGTYIHKRSGLISAEADFDAQIYTLLYVEDNPANLMLLEDMIARRPDMRLLSARDATRGVEIARTLMPDVILMDINLPGISGITALKILLDDPLTATIPVIALSANAMPRDIENGMQAGFFRYLTKPIIVNDFMKTLDMALKFAKARTGAENLKKKHD